MGLLAKAISHTQPTQKPLPESQEKGRGLLSSAIRLNQFSSIPPTPSLAELQPIQRVFATLRNFVQQRNIQKFAVISTTELTPETGRLIYSYGLDETTKERFMLDKKTFLDTLEDESIWTAKKDSLHSFNFDGFFSSKEYESITEIFICKISSKFFMIIDSLLNTKKFSIQNLQEDLKVLYKDLQNLPIIKGITGSALIKKKNNTKVPLQIKSALSQGQEALLLSLSVESLIREYSKTSNANDLELIYQEILFKTQKIIGTSNLICDLGRYKLNIVIFSTAKTDSDFYLYQLNKSLHSFTGDISKQYFELKTSLNSKDYQEILNFISCDIE